MKNTILLFLMLAVSPLNASDILPVFSTGVDSFQVPVLSGSIDLHYSSGNNQPAYVVDPQVVANPSGSGSRSRWGSFENMSPQAKWISFSNDPTSVDNRLFYSYETTFDLSGKDTSTFVINGWMASSWSSSVYLNGNYLFSHFPTQTEDTFTVPKTFSISSSTSAPLLSGLNSLTFEVSNGSPSLSFRPPNGVVVGLTSSAVPEPSGLILAATGAAIGLLIKLRKSFK